MLKPEEMGNFRTLLRYVHNRANAVYSLDMSDEIILAYYDTDFESDNCLEDDDPKYEEYHCILFKKVSDGTLFEVNYHNLPKRIMDGDTVVISEKQKEMGNF